MQDGYCFRILKVFIASHNPLSTPTPQASEHYSRANSTVVEFPLRAVSNVFGISLKGISMYLMTHAYSLLIDQAVDSFSYIK